MPKFNYTAVNGEGHTIEGQIDATSRESAVGQLIKQKMRPISVKQESGKANTGRGFGKKVRIKDLVIFTRQMSTMVSAGVPLTRALNTMGGQTSNKYFKTVIEGVNKDVEGGIALGDAFAKYPRVFSDIYVSMVRAGEAGGILDEILKRLALQVEQDASLRKKIKGAMTYPIVIFSITIIAFFGITMFVLPKIGRILTDLGGPNAKLPIYTVAMLNISAFMQKYAFFIIVVFVVVVYLLRRYLRTPGGKYRFHSLVLKVPVLKDIVMKVAIARFARTFASLMSSGVTVLDALETTGGAIGNKVIQKELQAAAIEVKNGKQLSEPLSKSKHFPAIVPQMLSIGEETGQTDTILIKVADFYEEEVATVINSLSSIIEPLMIVVLGALVGLIAASVMGPIASLSKNIGN